MAKFKGFVRTISDGMTLTTEFDFEVEDEDNCCDECREAIINHELMDEVRQRVDWWWEEAD